MVVADFLLDQLVGPVVEGQQALFRGLGDNAALERIEQARDPTLDLFPFADVRLLLNATRSDILRALARYRQQLEPQDRLLIY